LLENARNTKLTKRKQDGHSMPMNIQVVGAGGWGLALARRLALNGQNVRLWCRNGDSAAALRETRENPALLPGVRLPDTVEVARDIDPDAELAVYAVPSHAMRCAAEAFRFSPRTIRVSVAKGIENETLLRMSEVIAQAAPGGGPVVSLSGPTHAEEVGRDLPASIVAAGTELDARELTQCAFFAPEFRVYTSPDIIGVELGGSLKNVIAIAAGVSDGFALGDNAKAMLMTRGLAEIARLGVACGADPVTFAGLSGMGDLIVTCASRHSRNRRVGELIAQGKTLDEILGGSPMVAEGVLTAKSARALAQKMGVEMPLANAVHAVLYEGVSALGAITGLMLRQAKPERG
jgi:glycerol-3-phosphate dehydrogenase (NAD(P)+)